MNHYKKGRDLRVIKPSMKETLELWKTPASGNIYEETEIKARIADNINKHKYNEYSNEKEVSLQNKGKRQEEKDYSWFQGCHEDSHTILYIPPPQGWHVDRG
jgi:hypothetical protein